MINTHQGEFKWNTSGVKTGEYTLEIASGDASDGVVCSVLDEGDEKDDTRGESGHVDYWWLIGIGIVILLSLLAIVFWRRRRAAEEEDALQEDSTTEDEEMGEGTEEDEQQ